MESYFLMHDDYIQRQSDLAMIPMINGNLDYAKYLEDVANGAAVTLFDYEAETKRQNDATTVLITQQQKDSIITQLSEIDIKKVRCISDHVLGNSIIIDGVTLTASEYLTQLESQQVILRQQLAAL